MRMCLLLLLSLSALLNFSAYAEVYKTTDKQGRVVYTDQPAASDTKAKIVELPKVNQLPATPITAQEEARPKPPELQYIVTIITPTPETRLMPGDRTLTISISADHSLEPGHIFVYFFNGEKVAETTEQTFTLNEPPRGEHKISVAVVDQDGRNFGQSAPVTVYVMRPTVKH